MGRNTPSRRTQAAVTLARSFRAFPIDRSLQKRGHRMLCLAKEWVWLKPKKSVVEQLNPPCEPNFYLALSKALTGPHCDKQSCAVVTKGFVLSGVFPAA